MCCDVFSRKTGGGFDVGVIRCLGRVVRFGPSSPRVGKGAEVRQRVRSLESYSAGRMLLIAQS